MIRRCILPAIAALALMAVPAQAAQTPTTAATPAASAAATPSSPAADALPVLLQVPDGLVQVDDQTLSLDDTVLGFEDQEEAREKLQEWGWETTLSRSFAVPPDETANPTEIQSVFGSVYVFADAGSAADALDYITEYHVTGADREEIEVDGLGDDARALYAELEYGNEMTIYAVKDNMVIRVSAASPNGDPRNVATAIMEALLSE